MTKNVKLQLLGHVEGDVKLNQKPQCTSMLSKGRIYSIAGIDKGIKLKLSGYVKRIKRQYMYPGCQNGISAIFKEELKVFGTFKEFLGGCLTKSGDTICLQVVKGGVWKISGTAKDNIKLSGSVGEHRIK